MWNYTNCRQRHKNLWRGSWTEFRFPMQRTRDEQVLNKVTGFVYYQQKWSISSQSDSRPNEPPEWHSLQTPRKACQFNWGAQVQLSQLPDECHFCISWIQEYHAWTHWARTTWLILREVWVYDNVGHYQIHFYMLKEDGVLDRWHTSCSSYHV